MNKKKGSEALNRGGGGPEKQNQNTVPAESFLPNTTIAWEAERMFCPSFSTPSPIFFFLGIPHQN